MRPKSVFIKHAACVTAKMHFAPQDVFFQPSEHASFSTFSWPTIVLYFSVLFSKSKSTKET